MPNPTRRCLTRKSPHFCCRHSFFKTTTRVLLMQAIPSTLFFIIPVFSLILLCIRLSAQQQPKSSSSEPRDRFPRPLLSYFAFFSFGVLSAFVGSLGLAAFTLESRGMSHSSLESGKRVIITLIKYQCKHYIRFGMPLHSYTYKLQWDYQ
jgi:hypothetical protein